MTLVLTLVLSAVAFTALFWALGVLVQGYLYSQPADKLPIRAVVAGVLVALFITGWTYANTRASHPEKYSTLLEFKSTAIRDVTEFDAVRRLAIKDEKGQPKEVTVAHKWIPEGKLGKFVEITSNKDFRMNTADYMTIAIELSADGKKTRLDATIDSNGRYVYDGDNVVFTEKDGARYIESQRLTRLNIESTGAMMIAIGLNVLSFVVLLAAFWPILRFNLGHSVMLTLIFAAIFQGVMPMIFLKNTL